MNRVKPPPPYRKYRPRKKPAPAIRQPNGQPAPNAAGPAQPWQITKIGRPSTYTPQHAILAGKIAAIGGTDKEIADVLNISLTTVGDWRARYEDFALALTKGKDKFQNERVKRSLFHSAVGYDYPAEKIVVDAKTGNTTRVKYVEHVPPSPLAQKFWLSNRDKSRWADAVQHNLNGKVEHIHSAMTPEQALTAYVDTLRAPQNTPLMIERQPEQDTESDD